MLKQPQPLKGWSERGWLDRAQQSDYQEAYDIIASFVNPAPVSAVIDLACGQGDILSRLHTRFPRADLCGLDASNELLDAARQKVGRTVNLTRFDLLSEGPLPIYLRGRFNYALFTFPCLPPFGAPTTLTLDLEQQLRSKGHTNFALIAYTIVEAHINTQAALALKPDGTYIFAEYGNPPNLNSTNLDLLTHRMQQLFHLVSSQHTASSVGGDVDDMPASGFNVYVLRRTDVKTVPERLEPRTQLFKF